MILEKLKNFVKDGVMIRSSNVYYVIKPHHVVCIFEGKSIGRSISQIEYISDDQAYITNRYNDDFFDINGQYDIMQAGFHE